MKKAVAEGILGKSECAYTTFTEVRHLIEQQEIKQA